VKTLTLAFAVSLALLGSASAQQPATPVPAPAPPAAPAPLPGYGPTITLEKAKKVAAAAQEEAKKMNLTMAIAVVEPNGSLVYFEMVEGTQYGSVDIAIGKAKTSALLRRTTKLMQEQMGTPQGNFISTFPYVVAIGGGIPILEGNRIIGAIGASGSTAANDHIVAEGGVAAIK